MRTLLIWMVIAFYAVSIEAATKNSQLVRVHRVTREEYDELKRLSHGKNEVSEARIISSGIAGLKGLVTGLTAGISTNILPFLNFFNPQPAPGKDGYPLCVISASDVDVNQERDVARHISWTQTTPSDNGNSGHDHDHNHEHEHDRDNGDDHDHDHDHGHDHDYDHDHDHGHDHDHNNGHHDHGHHQGHDHDHDHGHEPGYGSSHTSGNSDETPIVNCILIIKDKNDTSAMERPTNHPHYPHHPNQPQHSDHPHHPNHPNHPNHPPHYDPNYGYPPPPPPPPGYPYSLPPPPPGYYYGPPLPPPMPYYPPYDPYNPMENGYNPEHSRTVNYYDYRPYLGYYRALTSDQRSATKKSKRKNKKRPRANQLTATSQYEPINYPQHDYASTYPKISRNNGLTHPAPVYVRNPQQQQQEK